MAWRKPTEDDLLSSLSREEVEAYRQSGAFSHDPVDAQLMDVAEYVRGYIRSAHGVRMDPEAGTLPSSLVAPAMDYLRFKLLTRMSLEVGESRTKAWERAQELFEKIAEGLFIPESSGDEPSTEANLPAGAPATGRPNPEKRLLD